MRQRNAALESQRDAAEARTASALSQLPSARWSEAAAASASADTTAECCLCMEEFGPSDEVRLLPCKHYFHAACVDRWFASRAYQQRSCPLCKADPLEGQLLGEAPAAICAPSAAAASAPSAIAAETDGAGAAGSPGAAAVEEEAAAPPPPPTHDAAAAAAAAADRPAAAEVELTDLSDLPRADHDHEAAAVHAAERVASEEPSPENV